MLRKKPSPKRGDAGRSAPPWWMRPSTAPLLLGIPLLISAYLIPQRSFVELYDSPKYVDTGFLLIGLAIYVGFLAGCFVTLRSGTPARPGDVVAFCRWFVWPLFCLTMLGYLVWFANAVLGAGGVGPVLTAFSEVLAGQDHGTSDYVKDELFREIPGITTLTQVGILYATVEAVLWTRGASSRRLALTRFAVVILLGLARAMLLSERLALIEIVVPIGIVLLNNARFQEVHRTLVRFMPFVLALTVFTLFAAGEYFRSWTYYRSVYTGTYVEFAVQRFLGYYTTAVNNAAIVHYFEPLHPLRHTFDSLFVFPLLGEAVSHAYAVVFGGDYTDERNQQLLQTYANPEFNNVPIVGLLSNEYSALLAPMAAVLLGILSASLFRSFASGRLVGVLLYPSWFVGLLEISRVYYWASSRYFPVLAVLLGALLLFEVAKVPRRRSLYRGGRSLPRGGATWTARRLKS